MFRILSRIRWGFDLGFDQGPTIKVRGSVLFEEEMVVREQHVTLETFRVNKKAERGTLAGGGTRTPE